MRRCGVEGDHREHFNLSHCKVLTAGKGQLPMARFVLFTDKFDDNRRRRGERGERDDKRGVKGKD